MDIAVLTFDGFNELDSFVVASLLNRGGLKAWITTPGDRATSRFGVEVAGQKPLSFAREADAVVIGSGMRTREHVANPAIVGELRLDPGRQMIATQCSGALFLPALGLVQPGQTVCTDMYTAPDVRAAGLKVSEGAFTAAGNVASAGGCLSSPYIASWMIGRALGADAVRSTILSVAPVGEEEAWIARALAAIGLGEPVAA